jgi:predicted CDP-diglyceride synthetase/phosphatidate cytidylyltransferase
MINAIKLGARRMAGVGTVLGLLDVANSRPEERMGKLKWLVRTPSCRVSLSSVDQLAHLLQGYTFLEGLPMEYMRCQINLNQMRNKISYFYYYIFFNAYWSSIDVGEKSMPRQNAVHYMAMVKIFVLSTICFSLSSTGIKFNLTYSLIAGILLILTLNHKLLSEKIFKKKYDRYSFLKEKSKRRRMLLFVGLFVISATLSTLAVYLFVLESL